MVCIARILRRFLGGNVSKFVFRTPEGTCFTGVTWFLSGSRVDAQKARFLRDKCGLSGLMNIDFRSFRPLRLANVSVFLALFSALRLFEPFEALICFI